MAFKTVFLGSILLFGICLINFSYGGDTNSQLFPPGSLGSEFNVTGPLNSFVEQIQANSRPQAQEVPLSQPIILPIQQPQYDPSQAQIPPTSSVIYAQVPIQPVVAGPQNRPSIDPALQRLLNSFNTNPSEPNRNTFIQANPPADANAPAAVSYITCYVGCSHVTNIVTSSVDRLYTINPTISVSFLLLSTIILLF